MPRRNEFMVGGVILLAGIIGVMGVRYLQGAPLLQSRYSLIGVFDDAQGLAPGSLVRISGIRVGRVQSVHLDPHTRNVHARMAIDPDVQIPDGSALTMTGLAALGRVNVSIIPGGGARMLASGDTLYAPPPDNFFAELQHGASGALTSATATMSGIEHMIGDPEGDFRMALAALRGASTSLDELLRAQNQRLSSTFAHLESATIAATTISSDIHRLTSTQADSVALLISNLNRSIESANLTMRQLGETSSELDRALALMTDGDGTLGLLMNDPALYHQLDSTLVNINGLIEDLQENPRKYLRGLVRVF